MFLRMMKRFMLFNGSQAYIWTKTEIMIGCNVEKHALTHHACTHARTQTDRLTDGRTDRQKTDRDTETQRQRDRNTKTQSHRATHRHTVYSLVQIYSAGIHKSMSPNEVAVAINSMI